MPNYLYKCPKCGIETTEFKPISELDSEQLCECGEVMKRQFGTTFFLIHGSKESNGYTTKKQDYVVKEA